MMNSKDDILNALDDLVGTWRSSGSMLAGDGPAISVAGTDSYEWLSGRQFMIHRADVVVGDEKIDLIEIIGEYDAQREACAMHAFQSDGSNSIMWATVGDWVHWMTMQFAK